METILNILDEQVKLYHLLKLKKEAQQRLDDISGCTYQLFLLEKYDELPYSDKMLIEQNILDEKKNILLYEIAMKPYKN